MHNGLVGYTQRATMVTADSANSANLLCIVRTRGNDMQRKVALQQV